MDARYFDALTQGLSRANSRRRLLGLLAALPLLGGLLGALDGTGSLAKERRRRRKQRRARRKGKRVSQRHRHAACTPQSRARVCAGKCGPVRGKQTCGKTVDCGSCDCPTPCGECFVCQSSPNAFGTCVIDAAQAGDACGSDGHVCQADGACACDSGSCANPTPICQDGTCVACSGDGHCLSATSGTTPICAAGSCVACSQSQPCPAGQCCQADGSCGTGCPVCQRCEGGLCAPDPSLQHSCSGPCPAGEWCDAGACASIQATVTIPDCQSLCGSSTEVCGMTVTCPDCTQCNRQTGCGYNGFQAGPLGPGLYCSLTQTTPCASNDDCPGGGPAAFQYCANGSVAGSLRCARTCPF